MSDQLGLILEAIEKVKMELKEDIAGVKGELKEEIRLSRNEFKAEILGLKIDIHAINKKVTSMEQTMHRLDRMEKRQNKVSVRLDVLEADVSILQEKIAD